MMGLEGKGAIAQPRRGDNHIIGLEVNVIQLTEDILSLSEREEVHADMVQLLQQGKQPQVRCVKGQVVQAVLLNGLGAGHDQGDSTLGSRILGPLDKGPTALLTVDNALPDQFIHGPVNGARGDTELLGQLIRAGQQLIAGNVVVRDVLLQPGYDVTAVIVALMFLASNHDGGVS